VQTLHFYHQTLHLLGARPSARIETSGTTPDQSMEARQIEIPLRAARG
jgi:hypothetical protein